VFFGVFRVFCVFCGNTAKHSQNTAKHPQNSHKTRFGLTHHKTHLLTIKQPEFANKPALAREGERRGEKGRGGAMLQGKIRTVMAGKTGARGWRDAGDCSSDDGAGGDDGGGVGDGDGRAGNAGGSGRGPMDATAA